MAPNRSTPWLLAAVLLAAYFAYGAGAQSVAVPVVLPRAPVGAVDASDVINFANVVTIPGGQMTGVAYAVPFGKRLVMTSLRPPVSGLVLVEVSGGIVTRKLWGLTPPAGTALGQRLVSFEYPFGLTFGPGTQVGLSWDVGYGPSPQDDAWEVFFVGVLVDA